MVIKTCRYKKEDIEIEKDESKDSRAYLRIKAKKKGNMVVDKVLWIDDKTKKRRDATRKSQQPSKRHQRAMKF
jgi:hypothetical protein